MSNPTMGFCRLALNDVKAQPTTPPAGPERTARNPVNFSAATRPPSDFMNSWLRPARPSTKCDWNAST